VTDAPFLTFDAVSHHYGDRRVLADCSFSLARGQLLALTGPNGAGKTTIAKLAAGFLAPTAGRVLVADQDAITYRRSRGIGFLTEELSVLGQRTVRELLALRPIDGRAPLDGAALSDALGLGAFLDRPLHRLSKGQRRGACIAYACMGPSALILLDEPESGLDPSAQERLHGVLRACTSHGATVIMLSHHLLESASLADHLGVVVGGRLTGWHDRDEVMRVGARELYRRGVANA
jgi:ABC-2 type transport system ATP-binding protein